MAEDKYPKTIKVNGQEFVVNSKEEEKQAREEAKDNNVEVEDISVNTDESGNSNTLQEDATVEETQSASTQETNQSQDNQINITELSLDDGSLESQSPKKGLEKHHNWFMRPTGDDLMKSDPETGEEILDDSIMSADDGSIAKYLDDQYKWTRDNDEAKDIKIYSDRNPVISFRNNERIIVDVNGKKRKFKWGHNDLYDGGELNPEKLNQLVEDINIFVDREVDNDYEELTDKEILNAVPMNKFWFDNTDKNKHDFADALDMYQDINVEYTDELGNSEHSQRDRNFKNGKFVFGDGRTISYEALWNMRTRMRAANLSIDSHKVYKEKVEEYGGEDGYDEHLSNNAHQFLYEEDRELHEIDKHLNNPHTQAALESGGFPELEEMVKRRAEIIQQKGYKPLFDDDGNFALDKNGKRIYTVEKNGEEEIVKPELDWWEEDNALEIADMAYNVPLDIMKKGRRDLHSQLIAMAKVMHQNKEQIGNEIQWYKKLPDLINDLDQNMNSFDNDMKAIDKIIENNDIFNLLDFPNTSFYPKGELPHYSVPTEFAGDSEMATTWNDLLRRYKTYNKAIELNADLTQTSLDNVVVSAILDPLHQSFFQVNSNESPYNLPQAIRRQISINKGTYYGEDEMSRNQYADVMKQILTQDLNITDEDVNIHKGSTGRRFVDGFGNVAAQTMPLVLSVAALMTPLRGTVLRGAITRWGTALTARSGWATKHAINTVAIPALFTTGEWITAEAGMEIVSQGGLKGHTAHYDQEKDEWSFNVTTPMIFGPSSSIAKQFQTSMWNAAVNSSYKDIVTISRYIEDASKTKLKVPMTMTELELGKYASIGGESILSGFTAAINLNLATAVGFLLENGEITSEQFAELTDLELISHSAAFFSIMSGRQIAELRNAKGYYMKEILKINPNSFSEASAKRLKLKKDKKGEYLDDVQLVELEKTLTDKKLNQKYSEKERNKRIKQIQEDIRNLRLHNEIVRQQGIYSNDIRRSNDLNAKFVLEQNQKSILDRLKRGQETYEDREAFAELTEAEMYEVLYRGGIDINSGLGLKLENYHRFWKSVKESADQFFGEHNVGSKERKNFFQQWGDLHNKQLHVFNLENQIKEDKTLTSELKPILDRTRKDLRALEDKFQETFNEGLKLYDKQLKQEIDRGRIVVDRLGGKLKDLSNIEFELAQRIHTGKVDPDVSAFVRGKNIYINVDRMTSTRSLTEINHEIFHFILRNVFKGPKGKITKQGKNVIDNLLSQLDFRDRRRVEEAMEERGYKEDGKVKDYEEYLTVLGDLIKNKKIKRTPELGKRLVDFFNPMLKGLGMPELGKVDYRNITQEQPNLDFYEQRKIDIEKSAKHLFDMIETLATKGVTEEMVKFSDLQGTPDLKFAASKSNVEGLLKKYNGDVSKMIEKTLNVDKAGNSVSNLENGVFGQEIAPIVNYLTNKLWNKTLHKGSYTTADFKNEVITNMAMIMLTEFDASKIKTQGVDSWLAQMGIQRNMSTIRQMGIESSKDLGGLGERSFYSEEILDKLDAGDVSVGNIDGKKISNQIKTEQNISTLLDQINLTAKLNEPIENAIKKIWGTELPQITSKDFLRTLEQHYITEAFKDLKNEIGTKDKYKSFHESNFDLLFDNIFVGDLIAMQKRGSNIFATKVTRLTNQRSIQNAIDVGLLAPSTLNKSAAGVEVFLKNGVELNLDWSQWKNIKPGDKGYTPEKAKADQKLKELLQQSYKDILKKGRPELQTWLKYFTGGERIDGRKDALIKALVKVFGHQKAIELLKPENSEIFDKYLSIRDLKNQKVAENELRQLMDLMDINPNIKYSRTKKNIGTKNVEVTKLGQDLENGLELIKIISKNLNKLSNVFTPESIANDKPVLTDKYKGKFSDKVVEDVYDVYLSGKISKDIYPALQKLISNVETKRPKVAEQLAINLWSKVKLFESYQEFQTETGGRQDVLGRVIRTDIGLDMMLGIEFKMWDAQLGSITINSHNISTGKINIKKINSYENGKELKDLVLQTQKGYEQLKNFFNDIAQYESNPKYKKALENYTNVSDPIPQKYYTLAKNMGLLKPITKSIMLTERVVENHYLNAQENPSHILQTLDGGVTYLGENISGINAPKFEANIKAVVRPVINSVKKNGIATDMVSISERILFTATDIKGPKGPDLLTEASRNSLFSPETIKFHKNKKNNRSLEKASENLQRILRNPEGVEKVGISVFDFDATVAHSENYVFAEKGGKKKKISAEEWPFVGETLAAEGWKFDFSDFNKVTRGTPAEYFKKMKERIDTYGPDNVFILTARAPQSQKAIHDWLKSNGINIPLKNITGLGNSTGEAKAQWMIERVAEGYNDLYFVDDARPNFDAVRKVLEKFDVDSYIVKADGEIKFSRNKKISLDFNKILEQRSPEIKAEDVVTRQEAVLEGKDSWFKELIPASAQDFRGLLYRFLGKGKQGEADMKFLKDNLLDPYSKGYQALNGIKNKMSSEYSKLLKDSKIDLRKKIEGTNFTTDMAIRMYLWNRNGFEVKGVDPYQEAILIEHVNSNPKLVDFANKLSGISRATEGYLKPGEYWMVESIGSDLKNLVNGELRNEVLSEWLQNKNEIFSENNLNKIQKIYGPSFRNALENILYRMETGHNRMTGTDPDVNRFYDWINGSVGATMFFNTRSAVLQTMSTVNFINWSDNNVFAASKAFANQPQYWKDFAFIFNSPTLKQRRAGMEIDVSASELTSVFEKGGKNPKAIFKYLINLGFTPTRIADSFAIASGGASFYRNRINRYIKEGKSKTEAEQQAWLDFQEISEQTQQSSRPDLISAQQAGPLGRLVLAWQNTPMQYTRLTEKAFKDIKNGRGDTKTNVSKIIYYGAMQNIMFSTLQQGLMWTMFGDDQEKIKEGEIRVLNNTFDTFLRGTGVYGAGIATLKNTLLQWDAQKDKGYGKDSPEKVVIEALSLSPPIGSKTRKLINAYNTYKFNPGVGDELGFRIENPNFHAWGNVIEAATNLPVARTLNKANNLEEALTGNHELWQRTALILGWNRWNIGIEDVELEQAKVDAKQKRIDEKKRLKEEEKRKQQEAEEARKKKEGIKTVTCSGTRSDGQPCKLTTETKDDTWLCPHHAEFKDGSDLDGDGKKEYQCTATKTNGERCKNKTENKNKKCYAHQ